jgi:hypothetical protein
VDNQRRCFTNDPAKAHNIRPSCAPDSRPLGGGVRGIQLERRSGSGRSHSGKSSRVRSHASHRSRPEPGTSFGGRRASANATGELVAATAATAAALAALANDDNFMSPVSKRPILVNSSPPGSSSSASEASPLAPISRRRPPTVVLGLNALAVQLETSDTPHGPGSASVHEWVHTGTLQPLSSAALHAPDATPASLPQSSGAAARSPQDDGLKTAADTVSETQAKSLSRRAMRWVRTDGRWVPGTPDTLMSTEPSVSMHAIPGKSTIIPAPNAAPARSDASSASVNQEVPCAAPCQPVCMAQQHSSSAKAESVGAADGGYTINVDPRAHLLSAALAKHHTATANALLEPDSSDEAHPQDGVAAETVASESSNGTMGYFGVVAEEARSALSCSDGTSTNLDDVLQLVAKPATLGEGAPPPGVYMFALHTLYTTWLPSTSTIRFRWMRCAGVGCRHCSTHG